MLVSALLLFAPLLVASVPVEEFHDHSVRGQLAARWFQDDAHPVHDLFRRGPTDGSAYPDVGSPTWSAGFPASTPDSNALPKAWVDALNTAVQGGKIPNVPQSTGAPGQNPKYPNGVNPNAPDICSSTYKCRIPGDHWDAPDGFFASSFDDGPYPTTDQLVGFLQQNKVKTTHFMIGVNILNFPRQFLTAWNAGDDIAVHTWTHPYMTTLSNLDVVAQLGWTMQIIHNSTGGRVPRFWRPPYGDSDQRVKAIAKEVFNLETVIWNQDTEDWSINSGPGSPTRPAVEAQMKKWLTGPKSPGLIILEHEIAQDTVGVFIDSFPEIIQNGWKFESLARLIGNDQVYQNSKDSDSSVTPDNILLNTPLQNMTTSAAITPTAPTSPAPQPGTPTAGGNLAAGSSTPSATSAATSIWDRASSLLATALGASVIAMVAL